MEKVGGIVLCGGKSSRMGMAKALLPFGNEVMVQRVVRILSGLVSPIVVVAADGQVLPEFDQPVTVARDSRPERGPLEGLAAGLGALPQDTVAAYVTSCDVPLLEPAFVQMMIDRLGQHDAAVPVQGPLQHPLAAVYRRSVLSCVESLLAADRLRPIFVFDEVPTARVPVEDLEEVDPSLNTLRNLNFPPEYFAALALAGFEAPPEMLAAFERSRQ
jgi:molybdopterin-guanine dinucleotide biosynthesis protein A